MPETIQPCPTLILCGGKGSRLKELGQSIPKALIPLDGAPILAHKLNYSLRQGFDRFILAIGYRGDLIVEAVGQMNSGGQILFSDSGIEAGMMRRIYDTREMFANRVIVTYGDSLANLDLRALLSFHQESGGLMTIVSAPIQSPFGLVTFDQAQAVRSIEEKPVLHYYIGTFVMEKAALEYLPAQIVDWPDGSGLIAFFKVLLALDRLRTYVHQGPDITFNTVEELDAAEKSYLKFHTHFQSARPQPFPTKAAC